MEPDVAVGAIGSLSQIKRGAKGVSTTKKCQRCLKPGHWTYDCKESARAYTARPSRTKLLHTRSSGPLLNRKAKEAVVPLAKPAGLADAILQARAAATNKTA